MEVLSYHRNDNEPVRPTPRRFAAEETADLLEKLRNRPKPAGDG
jgi:hypothetical protein